CLLLPINTSVIAINYGVRMSTKGWPVQTGTSDTLVLSSYKRGIQWEGRSWDRIRARLKSDGSCDLEVLVPVFDGDQMEWAFATGLMLIRACTDEKCTGPSLSEFKPTFEEQFRKKP
ncbi:hypothetical protein, partial [Xanthomonas theicola]|uniref:hypothetical protein n=1 Tax=Xanthomonas theicola TaxID=56464 RepID=UPI001B8002F3